MHLGLVWLKRKGLAAFMERGINIVDEYVQCRQTEMWLRALGLYRHSSSKMCPGIIQHTEVTLDDSQIQVGRKTAPVPVDETAQYAQCPMLFAPFQMSLGAPDFADAVFDVSNLSCLTKGAKKRGDSRHPLFCTG